MYQHGTLLTLLFEALLILIHFEYHWYLASLSFTLYCHYDLTLFTLSVVCFSKLAACCVVQLFALASIALVVSVVVFDSL